MKQLFELVNVLIRSGAGKVFPPRRRLRSTCKNSAVPLGHPSWKTHAAALALLLLAGSLRWHQALGDPRLAVDESDYTQAFALAAAGESPYSVPRFLYPPAFAVAGAAAVRAWGELPVVFALRWLNLLGACLLIWVSLAWTSWRFSVRLALGILLVALWAPVHQGIDCGNISLAVIGFSLAAIAIAERQAVLAGLGLGVSLVVKPLAPAIVALLAAWRSPAGRRPGYLAAGTALAVAALISLACGPELLPAMLAKTAGHLPPGHTVSLWRLAFCLGVEIRPTVLLALAVAAPLPWIWRRQLSRREFAVVGTTAALYALPLVWTHTLAFSLPAQLLAFERAASGMSPAAGDRAIRRRAVLTLAVLGALALSIQGSEALVAINDRQLWLQALYLTPPVLAPGIFAVYGLGSPSLQLARLVGK